MVHKNQIKLFENGKIRSVWDVEKEDWYFSVIDVIEVLTESKNPKSYWSTLKKRLRDEGNESVTNCDQLKLKSSDGKYYNSDVASAEQLFRLIQSVPSPKVEPFKLWLAKIGQERLDEITDPQIAIERAVSTYRKKGYSEEWIAQRLKTIEIRKELIAEWQRSGVEEGIEYAMLTNEITKTWTEMDIKEYKKFKGLKKENLRDNMSNIELVLNMLSEVSTTEISKTTNPEGLQESKEVAKKGGNIAKDARENLEKETGKKVLTKQNAKNPKLLSDEAL
jgi:hypothetical protein